MLMKNCVPAKAVFSSVLGRMAVVALTLVFLAPAYLQAQPSPAQIDQFKNLPRAQQEALAKQYGVDLDQITGGQDADANTLATPALPLDQDPRVRERERERERELDAEQDDDAEPKIERFGESLFNSKVSTFAVTDNAVVPSDYRLGAGDELQIQLYGKDNEKYSIQVGRSGEIQLPRLGPVTLAGLTFEEAQGVIRRRVNEQLIGVEVVIAMGRLRAISVFMAGELKVPGSYSISALSTASQALYVAGGVTEIGTLRDIQVKRAGKVIARFDAYDLLLRGDAGQDVRLQSGDVVFVPPFQRLATIEGEVKRPMSYELLRSESASDLVAMAGGYSRNAYPSASVLTRKSLSKNLPTVLNIDLTETAGSTPLLDGDTLRIPEAADTYENAINIQGAAIRPGVYAWNQGMRVSDLLTSVKRDLLPSVDLDYALIVREKNQRLQISVKQFNIGDAITAPGTLADPLLNPRDKLVLFELVDLLNLSDEERGILTEKEQGSDEDEDEKKSEEEVERLKYSREVLLAPILSKLASQATQGEPVQIVSISGAVKAPGSYPLEPGDRAFDLVRAAGGLKDSAYLLEAEFRRITAGDVGRVAADYRSIDLTSLSNEGSEENLALQSRDHLTVRNIPDWNPVDSIEIVGEIKFPGTYLVRRGETLSDIVNRAGGLTQEAFTGGAIFTRAEVAEIETLRAKEFATSLRNGFAASLLTLEEKTADFEEIVEVARVLEEYEGIGRLVINLADALAGDQTADLEVVDGDKLVIPGKNSTVTVVGEVRRQGTHSYQRNFDLDDYLSLSAGVTSRADDKAVYIVKANGSVTVPKKASWISFRASSQMLEPGDSIVVPIDSDYKDSTTFWRDITQIVYQGAIAIVAVVAL
ncbi:MAG: polysaccharide export outer membrane protein [Candidatus Azotimanducaceae bacterium]|jgi:polysaccharide export outer membrane protein